MNVSSRAGAGGNPLAFLAWIFIALAASSSFAATQDAGALPADARDVYEVIERARQALLADKYADASKAMEEVLQKPAFAELPKSDQFRAFLIAAFAAQGKEDYLGAHEFASIATEFPDATADTWVLRARLASWVDDWADAGTAITTLARRWPDSLGKINDQTISLVASKMRDDKKLAADRLELLNALFAAHFTHEWASEPADLWRDLVLDAMQRKDLARAREVLKRVTSPSTLVQMRVDRRYDQLVHAEPKAFDIAAAAAADSKRWRKIMDSNPRKLSPVVQYMYALLTVGGYQEAITLADRVLAKNAKSSKDKPEFEDAAEQINWIYDLKSQALRGLGKWDQALVMQESARQQRDNSTDKVSQAINLGFTYTRLGRPEDALKALDGIDWAHSLSGYGRMQLQDVRLRAYLQLGNREQAEQVFAYMRENRNDAPDTWQDAMLDWGDVDGAAAQYIERLHDPDDRPAALYSAQTFSERPLLPQEIAERKRWQALLARADVAATINEVGRREKHPIYDIFE
jgi:tetratricopeptide (TPR) repeat protein